jgi:hypothetical protein
MKLYSFIEGLQILRLYFDDPDGYHIGSEHDKFYVYRTDKPVSKEDVLKLQQLGWFQEEIEECGDYDPAEGWGCFT